MPRTGLGRQEAEGAPNCQRKHAQATTDTLQVAQLGTPRGAVQRPPPMPTPGQPHACEAHPSARSGCRSPPLLTHTCTQTHIHPHTPTWAAQELPAERVQALPWFFRDLPYSHDYFIEVRAGVRCRAAGPLWGSPLPPGKGDKAGAKAQRRVELAIAWSRSREGGGR